jgi:phenol hydroxylase P2 protein
MSAATDTGTVTTRPPVFIALQANNDTIPSVEAIQADNPGAELLEFPGMVKINAPGQLVIRRASIEERVGRDFDLREMQLNLISLAGEVDETEDQFILEWKNA